MLPSLPASPGPWALLMTSALRLWCNSSRVVLHFFFFILLVACPESQVWSQSVDRPRTAIPNPPGQSSPRASDVRIDDTETALPIPPIRVNVDLVLVPVTVTDAMNRQITGLQKTNFALYEDNQPKEIRYFSAEDLPISVGLILDFSKSMTDKIEVERAAVSSFFNAANPQDDYFVIAFSGKPVLVADTTQSLDSIQSRIGMTVPEGSTALLDAVYLGIAQMQTAHYSRRALLIISDGGDNHSRYRLRQIKDIVREADIPIYAIGIFDSALFKPFEEYMGRKWLEEITDETGGRTIAASTLATVADAAAAISSEMRNQYILGFTPAATGGGKWRKIRVRVSATSDAPPVAAHYRRRYEAP